MSTKCAAPSLVSSQGELVKLSYSVDHRHLEGFLEALASVTFPINPELYHQHGSVNVEFPAYSSGVEEVRAALARFGFAAAGLKIAGPV